MKTKKKKVAITFFTLLKKSARKKKARNLVSPSAARWRYVRGGAWATWHQSETVGGVTSPVLGAAAPRGTTPPLGKQEMAPPHLHITHLHIMILFIEMIF